MTHLIQAHARNLSVPLDDLLASSALLSDDIQLLFDAFADNWGNQTFRRVLVRASWSYIESVTFGLKRILLKACTLGNADLSAKTLAFLAEQRIEVNSRGEARVIAVRTDTMKNIKLALKLASIHFNVPWQPVFGSGSWQRLQGSMQLRHRLTHPKSVSELQVEDAELDSHRDAFAWFIASFNEFLLSMQSRSGHCGRNLALDAE